MYYLSIIRFKLLFQHEVAKFDLNSTNNYYNDYM